MSAESQQVAEQLQKWAKRMGFVPATGEYPSVETLQKICKGKTIPLWQSVIKQIKPKEEVLHIQKTLLLQRLESGKSLEKDPIPGHLCEQIILARKLAMKQKEKQELLDSIEKREASIRAKIKTLSKSGHKIHDLKTQTDGFKKKALLFKIKSKECRSKLDYYKEIANAADVLCPPHPNTKPIPSASTETVIFKCVENIRDFHSKINTIEIDEMDDSESQTTHLKDLWKQIISNINGWGAQELWETLNSKHFAELLEKISTLCWQSTAAIKRAENQNSLAILPAQHMASKLECISLETQIKIKNKELEMVKKELIKILEMSKMNSSQLLQSKSSNTSEIFKSWVDSQSEKAELVGKIEGIKSELIKLRNISPNRSSASTNFKTVKGELAKLDVQVEHKKRHLEENLAQLKVVAHKLQSVRAKALAQKSNFNTQAPIFLGLSKSKHVDGEFDSFSPPRSEARFTSTMIANETLSNLTFNTTLGSIPEKCGGQSSLSDLKIQLKESVSKEAKLFIKVDLKTVPYVTLKGKRVSVCNLMVQAPLITSRSTNLSHRNFMKIVQGPPFWSTPQIILNQLKVLTHVKALHLYQLLHQLPTPCSLQAPFYLGTLKQLTAKQEAALAEKLEGVKALNDKIDRSLAEVRSNLDSWIERPIQAAVPADLVVNGHTIREWCKLYDEDL